MSFGMNGGRSNLSETIETHGYYYLMHNNIILHEGTYEECEHLRKHISSTENAYISVDHEYIHVDTKDLNTVPDDGTWG